MRGKRTPANRRAEAVGLALTVGVPDAAKALGVPQRTLRHWKNDPEFAELGLSAREDVAAAMWVGIQVGLEEIHKGLVNPEERLRDKADATSMLIEKRALLVGDPTSRTETVNVTDGLDAEAKRRLRARLARSVRGESGTDGTGSDPDGTGAGVDTGATPATA